MNRSEEPALNQALDHALHDALDALWIKFLPKLKERVDILESAAAAVSANQLSLSEQQEANITAHKLAGVLGTFGLDEGTVLARELEAIYSREGSPDQSLGARLNQTASEIRAIIDSRK